MNKNYPKLIDSELYSDNPINRKEEDKLNRTNFVETLSSTIMNYHKTECLTIGLVGRWGSGKSSIINMVKTELDYEHLIFINFNPWNFSTQDNLYQQFFNLLTSEIEKLQFGDKFWIQKKIQTINKQRKKASEIYKEGDETLRQYYESKKSMPKRIKRKYRIYKNYPNYIIKKTRTLLNLEDKNVLNKYYKNIKNNSSLHLNIPFIGYTYDFSEGHKEYNSALNLKKRCNEYFRDLNYRFIVVIDDLDRMTGDEINQILILVKSLADFDNFIYILSYDKEVVVKSINSVPEEYKSEFLEKIIQLQFVVPESSPIRFNEMVINELKPIYEKCLKDNINTPNKFSILLKYIEPFLKNIRDLKRYINELISYSEFTREINVTDAFILIALHTFEYKIYLKLKNSESILLEGWNLFLKEDEEIKKMLNDFLNELEPLVEHIKSNELNMILKYLFPIFERKDQAIGRSEKTGFNWHKENRICSGKFFKRYFTLTLEKHESSSILLSYFLKLEDSDEIYHIINDEMKTGTVNSFLENFRYYIDEVPKNNVEHYIYAFMKCGDEIKFDNELNNHMDWIYEELFEKIGSKDKSFEILKDCINFENNDFTMSEFIYILYYDYNILNNNDTGIKTEDEMIISKSQVLELGDKLDEKLKESWKSKKLLYNNNLRLILFYWNLIKDNSDLKVYLNTFNYSDHDIFTILSEIKDKNELENYFDIDWLVDRAKLFRK